MGNKCEENCEVETETTCTEKSEGIKRRRRALLQNINEGNSYKNFLLKFYDNIIEILLEFYWNFIVLLLEFY